MSKFCALFSGSTGNATYLGCSGRGILIDAGVSAKALLAMLEEKQIDPAGIEGIFVTHEHIDHVNGLHAVAKKLHLPVFASEGTMDALEAVGKLKDLDCCCLGDGPISVAGLQVNRFNTPHDCAEGSSGYTVTAPDGVRMGIATDMGELTEEIKTALLGCNLVLLESNHDVMMLENGPYPYPLKRRILGDHGHLSNASCAAFLPQLVESGTTRIVLGHLSRENNFPDLALASARATLLSAGYIENQDFLLQAAPPSGGKVWTL